MKAKLIIIFLFILGASLFIYVGFFLPADRQNESSENFIITQGEPLYEIAQNLEKQELIRHRLFFVTHVMIRGEQENLKAGGYKINPSMTVREIADTIIKGESSLFYLIVPEGWNLEEVSEHLESFGINDFYQAAKTGKESFEKSFPFLAEIPAGASLEGFLFPDSYQFFLGASAEEIIEAMLQNFEEKALVKIKDSGHSLFEVITMASLLEKEAKTVKDQRKIADILWRRLEWGTPLELCSTIIYLTGSRTILIEDLKLDSPYNTYLYSGLPPGPISNPGLQSIEAALNPQDNPYWFYLSTPEGEIIFSQTLQEHNIKKAKYLP